MKSHEGWGLNRVFGARFATWTAMFRRSISNLLSFALAVCTFLGAASVALADPTTKFQFGDEVYEVPFFPEEALPVPFYPDMGRDKMLIEGIKIYNELSDADKEKFQELRTQKLLAHGWLLTMDTLAPWTRPEPETTSRWWELQSIFGENGKFASAKVPHRWIRGYIQGALINENNNLWRNPRLALGQGKLGFSVAVGHVANVGAYKWGFFTGHMVGITCVPQESNKLLCSFFFGKEKMDRRENYNFSLEWGLTIRLQKVTTDGIARSKVDGVHMTSIGPGAFGTVTGTRMTGWTSTLSIYGMIFGYFAANAPDPAMQIFFASLSGWMWYVQNMAITHTMIEQFNSPRFALDKIGDKYFALMQKLSVGVEQVKNICSRLATPPPPSIFGK